MMSDIFGDAIVREIRSDNSLSATVAKLGIVVMIALAEKLILTRIPSVERPAVSDVCGVPMTCGAVAIVGVAGMAGACISWPRLRAARHRSCGAHKHHQPASREPIKLIIIIISYRKIMS